MRRSDLDGTIPRKPPQFDGWITELAEICDTEGLELFTMAWAFAPVEPCEYLAALPGVLELLIARAKWADACAGRRDLRKVS